MRIDLHSHSSASDGTQPPADVVHRAHAAGVDVLALTDHDTVAGLTELVPTSEWSRRPRYEVGGGVSEEGERAIDTDAARALPPGMTLVPGMELSCLLGGRSLHLLAYLFDPDDPDLAAECRRIREDRLHRARGMVDRLAALGAPVTWEAVRRITGESVPGRPHIARALVAAGVVASVQEAFTAEWIGTGGRAYVERYAAGAEDGIALVRAAGGVPVLAHPRTARGGYVFSDDEIAALAGAGLAGVEVDHPDQGAGDRDRLRGLAAELGLFVTGASDDHGAPTGHRLGAETTSPEAYEALLDQATGAAPVTGEAPA